MFDAIFTASSGQSFSFGYKAGVLYSIDPIGDLPVELETSQGYQQVGATVESRSISGVTRTITGASCGILPISSVSCGIFSPPGPPGG